MKGSQQRVVYVSAAVMGASAMAMAATYLALASPLSPALGWMPPLEVSQSGAAASRGPSMAVDSPNDLHLIWWEDDPDPNDGQDVLYVHSSNSGHTWPEFDRLDTELDSNQATLAVDADGKVHIAWLERPSTWWEILYDRRSATGWELPQPETAFFTTTGQIQEPVIAVVGDYVYILWSYAVEPHFDLHYTRKLATATEWTTPTIAADTALTSLHPSVAVDDAGNLHVAWHEFSAEPGVDDIIYYISGTVGIDSTNWSPPITVSTGISEATDPDITVGTDGVVHVVFGSWVSDSEQYVYYANFPIDNTDNISATLIPGSRVEITKLLPKYPTPSIALNGPNEVVVVWNGIGWMTADFSDRVYFAMSEDQGASWSNPVPISPNDTLTAGFAGIGVDGTFIHVIWQRRTSEADHDILYARRFPVVLVFPLAFKNYP